MVTSPRSVLKGGKSRLLRVNLGFYTAGVPVTGYARDALEYSKPVAEAL